MLEVGLKGVGMMSEQGIATVLTVRGLCVACFCRFSRDNCLFLKRDFVTSGPVFSGALSVNCLSHPDS